MHSPLFLTRWQSPPDSTSWIKTAGPSGLLDPPPMVMPKLLDRATEMSWITPSPGWLRTHRHKDTQIFTSNFFRAKKKLDTGSALLTLSERNVTFYPRQSAKRRAMLWFNTSAAQHDVTWEIAALPRCCCTCSEIPLGSTTRDSGSEMTTQMTCCPGSGLLWQE